MNTKKQKYKTIIRSEKKKQHPIEQMSIDDLSKKILRLLSTNSRLSFRQIASVLGISVGTVIERIKKLKSNRVIESYTLKLNHEKLGYTLAAAIEITVSKGKLIEVEKIVAKNPKVCAVYDITGLTDALIIAKFKNRKELNDFVKSLLASPYIVRTNTHLILNTVKEDFSLV